ncbi:hypothetical protein HPB48_011029 [Haemaphysalis longicornis]|uniref:Uncharacterized protein n=1 Tax=Haemaphysalis longicornis TaxID=44386 RepID=A0A9J6GUL0_HAELO|nr:hypothetical protein HPB48_011029 [Haemaphysalis longicornis]
MTASRECQKATIAPPPTQLGHKLTNRNSHRPAPNYKASQQQRQTAKKTNTTNQVSWSAIAAPQLATRTSAFYHTPAAPVTSTISRPLDTII